MTVSEGEPNGVSTRLLGRLSNPFHLIKTAAADDPNGWCVSIHYPLVIRSEKAGEWEVDSVIRGARRRSVPVSCPTMPKFFIKTYGCQMNERDSEQVAHSLIERGYEAVTLRSGGGRRAAKHLQRARHGGSKGAREDGDARADREAPAGGCLRLSWLHGAGAGRRIARRNCRMSTWWSERKNFIASPITWMS